MAPLRRIGRTYRGAFSGIPKDAWLISIVVFLNRSGTMVLPFLALFLTRERGYSVIEAGHVLAAYGIGSILGSSLGGVLSDRIGPLRTQQLSLVFGGIGLFLLGQVQGSVALPLTALCASTMNDLFRPSSMAALARSAEGPTQARAFALMRLAVNLGMGIGPAAGGFLARVSYKWIFVCDAATSFAAAAVLLWFHGRKEPLHAPPAAHSTDSQPPWRDRPFLLLLVLVFALGCCFFQLFGIYPLYLAEHFGINEAGIGLVLALNCFLIVLFEMVLIHSVEGRERIPLAATGALLICTGFGLMPLSASLWWAVFTVCVWTLGEMLALPILNALVADRAGPVHRGKYLGAYSTAYSVAFALAPVLGTWAHERLGPDRLWSAIAALGVFISLGFFSLRKHFAQRRHGAAAQIAAHAEPAEGAIPD